MPVLPSQSHGNWRHSAPKLTERVTTLVVVETLRREVGHLDFMPLLSGL